MWHVEHEQRRTTKFRVRGERFNGIYFQLLLQMNSYYTVLEDGTKESLKDRQSNKQTIREDSLPPDHRNTNNSAVGLSFSKILRGM